MANSSSLSSPERLRLLPGLILVALQWFLRFALPKLWYSPEGTMIGFFGGLLLGPAVLVWWLFFSGAPRSLRWGGGGLFVAALAITPMVLHPSIGTGMMGLLFFVFAIPTLCLAFVLAVALSRNWAMPQRWVALLVAVIVGAGGWALVRSDGITGDAGASFAWRWTPTPEEELLAQAEALAPTPSPLATESETPAEVSDQDEAREEDVQSATESTDEPAAGASESLDSTRSEAPDASSEAASAPESPTSGTTTETDQISQLEQELAALGVSEEELLGREPWPGVAAWPGFRGPQRNGHVPGVRVATDWSQSPPEALWRQPVGPGWSSFAVDGDRIYTQEQRGDYEVVSCYDLSTGEALWQHRDEIRFWEANAGAGPRATPTLHQGKVFSLGATGQLNALDADDGRVLWSRLAIEDTEGTVPGWGYSSSPLVIADLVIVHVSALAAYDVYTGELRWVGPARSSSYSSPHWLPLGGQGQIVQMTYSGATGVDLDGTVLWEHPWKSGSRIVQPALTENGDLLLSAGETTGLRRIGVEQDAGNWSVEERWTTNRLKPYFSDFVVHQGHAYGFDGNILAAIELESGDKRWKGGRYGSGQLVLLPEQDLLLVISEDGDLVLVSATPDGFQEITRTPALNGKTWNHPVLVDDILLVRNAEEMAAYRLPLARG
ncbi:MAG: PQQ-binding-like beta-propeller repeat protein [Acidobacteriota bacterium]